MYVRAVLWTSTLALVTAAAGPGRAGPVLKTPSGTSVEIFSAEVERTPEVQAAMASFKQRNFAACLEQLTTLSKSRKELAPPKILLAQLLLSENLSNDGRAILEQSVAEDPTYPLSYILLGNLSLLDGSVTAAQLLFGKAADLAEKATAEERLKREWLLQCHYGRAAVAERREDWPAAKEALAKAVEMEPQNGSLRSRYAAALFHTDGPEKAAEELAKAFAADAALLPPPVSLGLLSSKKGDVKQAEQWLRKGVADYPSDARSLQALGAFLLQQNRLDEAEELAQKAAALDPESLDIKRLLGTIAWSRKDFAAAEKFFEQVYEKEPTDVGASNQLALSLAEQADSSKRLRALQIAEINARQYPRRADLLATLGWVNFRLGRINEADRFLSSAMSGGRATAEMAYFYAHLLAARGQNEELSQLLKSAIATQGAFAFRSDATAWLARLQGAPPAKDAPAKDETEKDVDATEEKTEAKKPRE